MARKKVKQEKQQPETKLTPYQGAKRCYGSYKCPECSRNWCSGHSWANCGQECLDCGKMVFPFQQQPLENPGGLKLPDNKKMHQQDMCEMYIKLGFHCGQVDKIKRKRKNRRHKKK